MDFAIALLPVTIIRHLNMSFKSKIGLCVLLGLGVMYGTRIVLSYEHRLTYSSAGIFTAIKTANLHRLKIYDDFTCEQTQLHQRKS